ncbi:MAG: VWA domain-containing protein [Actinobacteria bacterium]|nr:VWA domain-containing protein [Actinomycetota bacterium]
MRASLRFVLALLALVLAAPGSAALELRGVDASDHPTIRLTAVTSTPTAGAPSLRENGGPVAALRAENLGRAKSIVLAIDRSQSMKGAPLADAIAAARTFIAAKPAQDRIAVATFATEPVLLTGFSTATTDADGALRSIAVDAVQGTTFFDALVLASGALAEESMPGRVILAVTDGNETRSEATLERAIRSARDAGAAVYVVGIESSRFTPEPLVRLAEETGGAYYGAASSEALTEVYTSIARELQRTWRLEYVTAARPGDRIELTAKAVGDEAARTEIRLPGAAPAGSSEARSPVLPEAFLQSTWGALAIGGGVAFLVLLATWFAFASARGNWLKARLSPHIAGGEQKAKREREKNRLALAAGVFTATEKTFGHFNLWKRLASLLERADLPFRTVELVYVMCASAMIVGLMAAAFGPPALVVLCALGAGALLPYGLVSFRARRRLKAFESQLPDLLTTIAGSLKAGHSFRQGIQAVVDEGQEPSSKEFKRVLAETRLGRPMDSALAEMSRRVGSPNLEFVLTAVTIQRKVGGSLAGIFDMVAETVRNRHQFARKVKGLTAMGRASAYVLIGLPFFIALLLTFVNGEYMQPLWHTSTGHKLLLLMLVMMGIGTLILRKIVSFRS